MYNGAKLETAVTPDDWRIGSDEAWLQPSHTYPRGVEIFHQGQVLQEILFVASGMLKLTQVDAKGRECIVGLVLPNEWLGSAPVIANRPTPTSAITCSTTVLNSCAAPTFRRRLHEDARLGRQVLEAHAVELCLQASRIGQLCSLSSRQRLWSVLCLFAGPFKLSHAGSAIRLRLPLQLWELAEFVGITPEHLSRLLKAMEQEGRLRRENGWIVLRDVEAM